MYKSDKMALHWQLPFFNPSVPFTTPIQGGLLEGMSITVCGRVLPDADRFEVNLFYGPDIVLHVNPRYEGGSGYVTNNTNQNGIWGEEERKYETPFPRGQVFALQILVTQGSYKISTNGTPFFEYKHRMPFSWVDKIFVTGKVELSLVAFQYLPPHYAASPGSFMVPHKSIIYGGVQPGKLIIIQGVISPQAKSVVICLRHKTGIAFDIHLCFNLNVVVNNTYMDGKWGNEEHSELTLFKTGEPLQILRKKPGLDQAEVTVMLRRSTAVCGEMRDGQVFAGEDGGQEERDWHTGPDRDLITHKLWKKAKK